MPKTAWLLIVAGVTLPGLQAQVDWPSWGHDAGNQRHSPLKQINTRNVSKLVPAWQYDMKKEGQPFRDVSLLSGL